MEQQLESKVVEAIDREDRNFLIRYETALENLAQIIGCNSHKRLSSYDQQFILVIKAVLEAIRNHQTSSEEILPAINTDPSAELKLAEKGISWLPPLLYEALPLLLGKGKDFVRGTHFSQILDTYLEPNAESKKLLAHLQRVVNEAKDNSFRLLDDGFLQQLKPQQLLEDEKEFKQPESPQRTDLQELGSECGYIPSLDILAGFIGVLGMGALALSILVWQLGAASVLGTGFAKAMTTYGLSNNGAASAFAIMGAGMTLTSVGLFKVPQTTITGLEEPHHGIACQK